MTNLVYVCRSPAATANSAVIVRVFGQGGALFSQRDERNIFLLASNLGLGPKCLVRQWRGRLPGGIWPGCWVLAVPVTLQRRFPSKDAGCTGCSLQRQQL